jgi:hypothetical protein
MQGNDIHVRCRRGTQELAVMQGITHAALPVERRHIWQQKHNLHLLADASVQKRE